MKTRESESGGEGVYEESKIERKLRRAFMFSVGLHRRASGSEWFIFLLTSRQMVAAALQAADIDCDQSELYKLVDVLMELHLRNVSIEGGE